MKTLVLITFLATHSVACIAQSVAYHLPEKKLRITVTYKLTGYALTSTTGDKVIDRKYEMVIADPVKVEEVVVPDRNRRFEVRMPERLSSTGARFGWTVQLDKNGILAGWNASREPVVSQILAGGAGFVANILTGLTPVDGLLQSVAERTYKVDAEQKFTVTEMIDIPVAGLDRLTVAAPAINVPLAIAPSVTVSLTPVVGEAPSSEAGGRTDVLYYVEPRAYRLLVDVNNNALIPSARIIDEIIRVPQHGALKHIAFTELFKGRKAAALSLNPATGQILSWEYKRSGNTRTETNDLGKQLTTLAEAIAAARAAEDRRLEQEVMRLKLEMERRELREAGEKR